MRRLESGFLNLSAGRGRYSRSQQAYAVPLIDTYNEVGARLYDRIFSADMSAEQLLPPTLVARRVKKEVAALARRSASEIAATGPANVDWLPYARTHLVGLIAEGVSNNEAGQTAHLNEFLSPGASRARLATIDDWFGQAFDEATGAVRYRMDVFTEPTGLLTNLREYFRNTEHYIKDDRTTKTSGRVVADDLSIACLTHLSPIS